MVKFLEKWQSVIICGNNIFDLNHRKVVSIRSDAYFANGRIRFPSTVKINVKQFKDYPAYAPMFHLHGSLRYYLYPMPVDMRKSFYTMSGVVNSLMNQNVRVGGAFIFMIRHQNVRVILHMEYDGLVIYHRRLESGRFKLPVFDENTASISIDWKDLMSMVKNVKPRYS